MREERGGKRKEKESLEGIVFVYLTSRSPYSKTRDAHAACFECPSLTPTQGLICGQASSKGLGWMAQRLEGRYMDHRQGVVQPETGMGYPADGSSGMHALVLSFSEHPICGLTDLASRILRVALLVIARDRGQLRDYLIRDLTGANGFQVQTSPHDRLHLPQVPTEESCRPCGWTNLFNGKTGGRGGVFWNFLNLSLQNITKEWWYET